MGGGGEFKVTTSNKHYREDNRFINRTNQVNHKAKNNTRTECQMKNKESKSDKKIR